MATVSDILESLNEIKEELKKMNVLEKKINSVKQDINEIKGLVGVFLDDQSNRKDTFGKNADSGEEKKHRVFPIEDVPRDERPPNWDFEIELSSGRSFNLWAMYQDPKGKQILQRIIADESGDEDTEKYKKKIKEFRPEAKAIMTRLIKQEQENRKEKDEE